MRLDPEDIKRRRRQERCAAVARMFAASASAPRHGSCPSTPRSAALASFRSPARPRSVSTKRGECQSGDFDKLIDGAGDSQTPRAVGDPSCGECKAVLAVAEVQPRAVQLGRYQQLLPSPDAELQAKYDSLTAVAADIFERKSVWSKAQAALRLIQVNKKSMRAQVACLALNPGSLAYLKPTDLISPRAACALPELDKLHGSWSLGCVNLLNLSRRTYVLRVIFGAPAWIQSHMGVLSQDRKRLAEAEVSAAAAAVTQRAALLKTRSEHAARRASQTQR